MKSQNNNYTSICWFCGVIFKSNRSTAKFCESKHRPLYDKYGQQLITTHILDAEGVRFNVDHCLKLVYKDSGGLNRDGWSAVYSKDHLTTYFNYKGPFSKGSEILVLGSYVMKRNFDPQEMFTAKYLVKPFTLLSKEERATRVFEGKRKEEGSEIIT